MDRDTRRALLEAIRADVRLRVDHILDRFIHRAYEARTGDEGAGVLEETLVDVSYVLGEGIAAQVRENRPLRPGTGIP